MDLIRIVKTNTHVETGLFLNAVTDIEMDGDRNARNAKANRLKGGKVKRKEMRPERGEDGQ